MGGNGEASWVSELNEVGYGEDATHQLRDDDVATLSHDLKNPLSMIALDLCMLQERLPAFASSELRRTLARIGQNVAFIDRLVHDLLDLSLIDAARLEITAVPLELSSLVEEVIERATSARDRTRVRVEVGEPVIVLGDGARLERVIANLLGNALKYSPRGSQVVVRLAIAAQTVRVSVIDHGPGLDPAEASTVFEKFRRASSARGREGAGLGLFVSHQIVAAHGGRIGVDSVVGEGSCFYFELPMLCVPSAW